MTRKWSRISALQQLTAVALASAQADFGRLKAKEDDLRRNLSDLMTQKAHFAQLPRTARDPALIAGADMRWQQWADQRRAAINMELAQVLARIDQSRHELQHAFGRDQASKALVQHAKKESILRQTRRSDHES